MDILQQGLPIFAEPVVELKPRQPQSDGQQFQELLADVATSFEPFQSERLIAAARTNL
jgi:hypothetical protein